MLVSPYFTSQMNRLVSAFGDKMFTADRLKRIHTFVKDLPESALAEIVDHFIDTLKFAPTPKEFGDAAIEWRRSKQQFYIEPTNQPFVPACSDCFETGYIFCQLTIAHDETLAYCHCDVGDRKERDYGMNSHMPRWEKNVYDRAYGFILHPFPVDKFVPGKLPDSVKSHDLVGHPKVEWWKKRKKDAHQWWKDQAQKSISRTERGL